MKQGWKTAKLNDACFVDYGTRVVKKKDGGSIYPVYGGGGETFKMDTYNREDCLVVGRFAMSEKCTRFVKGRFFLNDSGLTVRAKDKDLSQSFLEWALVAKNDIIYSFGKGSAQKNLDMDDFRNMEFSYPTDLTEQQRIVDVLDAEFAKIDALKANAEKNLQNAKDLFQTSLSSLFQMKREWGRTKLGDIAEFKNGLNFSKKDGKEAFRFLGVGDFKENTNIRSSSLGFIYQDSIDAEYFLKDDDIVFVRSNGSRQLVGRSILIQNEGEKTVFSGFCIRCRLSSNAILPKFLISYLSLESTKRILTSGGGGCNISNLNQKVLSSLSIPVPPIKEQEAIIESFNQLKGRCHRLHELYMRIILLCDDLKQALLRKAFNGELI